MAQNFSLSPEDRLLWQERAPRASYWFRVSDTHPFIHAGQPAAARSDTPPPPPYMPTVPPPPAPTGPPPIPVPTYQPPAPAPTHRPPAPMPASQPPMPAPAYHPTMPMPPYQPTVPMPPMPMPHYLPPMHLPTHPPFGNGQFIPGIPQLPHPIVMNPLPAINPVPIYDVRNQNNTALAPENPSRSSLPSRFTVSVPLKRISHQDTLSRAEIFFEWDIPCGDFYDRICARMDVDPRDAALGYKFDADTKRSIIRLPPHDVTAFNAMLDKVKSRVRRARSRAVVLEIHDLEARRTTAAPKKKRGTNVVKPSATVKQTHEYKRLVAKLMCSGGHRPFCLVASDSSHKALTAFQVSLWARMIAEGTATLEEPPNVPAFDYLPKRVQKGKTVPVPEIHVHLPTRFDIGSSSTTQAEEAPSTSKAPEVVHYEDEEIGEPSPSAFKTEDNVRGWKF